MYQAKWKDRVFSITSNTIRTLTELGTSYKVKKKTDGTSSTTVIEGHELQAFTINYEVSLVTGVNPLTEYSTMKSYLGDYGPLLLQGKLYGPNNVMLEGVELDSDSISNDGKLLSGKITLKFKEYNVSGKTTAAKYISQTKRTSFQNEPKAIADRILKVFYNGVNITDDISINSCVHDMFACSTADTLTLKFNDINKVWDSWKPQNEDLISIVCGVAKSGAMYINSVIPENGLMTLRASSIPPTAKTVNNKSWENVRLLQLAKEIAKRHGLGFESYGVDDRLYSYVRQENKPDFEFLQQRCELESLAFLVYDKKLILYSEEYLEKQAPEKTITIDTDKDFTYTNNAQKGYGKITIKNGDLTGTYTSSNKLSKVKDIVISTYMSGQDEANRFAKGILRQENKNLETGIFKDAIMREFSAGSIMGIKTTGASSWNGNAFISHIRHDYVKSTSKIFFRKAEVV
jgi:hypothetical protein